MLSPGIFLERVEIESLWLFCSDLTDVLIGCKPFGGFKVLRKNIGGNEVGYVASELVVIFVIVAFNSCFLERSVYSPDLDICPWISGLCSAVTDVIRRACIFEFMTPDAFPAPSSLESGAG